MALKPEPKKPVNPASLSTEDAARLLSRAGGVEITAAMVRADVEAGAPANRGGTINLVQYTAWLGQPGEMTMPSCTQTCRNVAAARRAVEDVLERRQHRCDYCGRPDDGRADALTCYGCGAPRLASAASPPRKPEPSRPLPM